MLNWLFKPSASKSHRTAIGLMSGTSLDALDAALVRENDAGQIEVLQLDTVALPRSLQTALETVIVSGHTSLSDLLQLEHAYTELVIAQCQRLISESNTAIDVIGFHGQTLWHAPGINSTLQIGHAEWLSEATQTPVVAQFRRGDMARGGQGAPLAPLFHAAHFQRETETVGVLNLGGIANLTVLCPNQPPRGWDLGPANTLSDQWYRLHHAGAFDRDGQIAASGTIHEGLLQTCLTEPFFQAPPPKSTGREHFNLEWLQTQLKAHSAIDPADVQATLNRLTAEVVKQALPSDIDILIVCGGGVKNSHLMDCIDDIVKPLVVTSDIFDIDPMAVESACFGWLAIQALENQALDAKAVTGATRNGLLGTVYYPTRD